MILLLHVFFWHESLILSLDIVIDLVKYLVIGIEFIAKDISIYFIFNIIYYWASKSVKYKDLLLSNILSVFKPLIIIMSYY